MEIVTRGYADTDQPITTTIIETPFDIEVDVSELDLSIDVQQLTVSVDLCED